MAHRFHVPSQLSYRFRFTTAHDARQVLESDKISVRKVLENNAQRNERAEMAKQTARPETMV
jgi:hypothetical protein